MTDCDHVRGYSKNSVAYEKTGEVIVTWLTEVRQSNLPMWFKGVLFNFCPDCGVKLDPRDITECQIRGASERRSAE